MLSHGCNKTSDERYTRNAAPEMEEVAVLQQSDFMPARLLVQKKPLTEITVEPK